jgi:hypothetical protein
MKRVAIAVGIIAAAGTGTIATASSAGAAPSCPAPVVTVSPQTHVSQDGTLTITAQHLFCTTSTKNGAVNFSLNFPGYAADEATSDIPVPPSGNLTYPWKLSSKFFTAPGGTKIPLLLQVSTPDGHFASIHGPTITLAAPPPGAGAETVGYNGAPTAVPAGSVDTSRGTDVPAWETGALVLGGVALLGGGVAATRRRASQH